MKKQLIQLQASPEMRQAASAESFRVGVRSQAESVDILVHGIIGDGWDGLDSGSIESFLADNRGKSLNVRINSGGGLAWDGIAIYNALVQHDAVVNVIIEGMAGSAASVIAMAGDRIKIASNGQFFAHRAWGIMLGNTRQMANYAKFLAQVDDAIAATYAARTGRTVAKMLEIMDGEVDGTTFTGQAAVDAKFADEVLPLKSRKNLKTEEEDEEDDEEYQESDTEEDDDDDEEEESQARNARRSALASERMRVESLAMASRTAREIEFESHLASDRIANLLA